MDDANQTNVKALFLLKDQFGAALAHVTYGNKAASVAALYAVQTFLEGVLFPKGEGGGARGGCAAGKARDFFPYKICV